MDNEKMNKKQAKEQAKYEKRMEKERIKDEKERIRNSFGHRFKSFILTVIFVIILAIAGFFGLKYYLGEKQAELYNEEMNYYYSKGEEYLESKEYEKAIKMFKKVEKDADKYKDAKNKLEETMKVYIEDYVSSANNYVELKEYNKAIAIFDELSDEIKNTDEVQDAIADIVIKKVENEISEKEELYEQIIIINEEMKDSINSKVEEKLDDMMLEKVNSYVEELKEKISAKNYETYKEQVEKIVESIGEPTEVTKKLYDTLETYRPKDLLSLNYEKEDTLITSTENGNTPVRDTKGDMYSNYILVNESEKQKDNTITWDLNGEYTLLSGKIALNEEISKVTSKGVKISIIGDGKTIYKSKKIKKTTNPFEFNVDVSKVKELKIILESDKGISYVIGNPIISK